MDSTQGNREFLRADVWEEWRSLDTDQKNRIPRRTTCCITSATRRGLRSTGPARPLSSRWAPAPPPQKAQLAVHPRPTGRWNTGNAACARRD